MNGTCAWCQQPMVVQRRGGSIPLYCSDQCGLLGRRQKWAAGLWRSPAQWDGTSPAVQLPLPLRWRMSCLLCGRDRWLFKPLEEMRHMHRQACPTCRGFLLVELDYGLARPGLEWVA